MSGFCKSGMKSLKLLLQWNAHGSYWLCKLVFPFFDVELAQYSSLYHWGGEMASVKIIKMKRK